MKKVLLMVFVAVAIIATTLIIGLKRMITIQPPVVNYIDTSLFKTVYIGDSLVLCDSSWLHKSNTGLFELYTQGDPYYRGLIEGKLTHELLQRQEKIFVGQLKKCIPSKSYQRFLIFLVKLFNRNIDSFVKPEYLREIYGVSQYADKEYDFIGSNYQRMLNYHAAHDIGHMMQNYHLVGCTSFAVWGNNSKDSSLLIGRNFDFHINDEFAEDKIISFVKPDSGYNYMMITWGGMTGVVSGMNVQGLTVTLNAAKSYMPRHVACPVSLMAKHILQYAKNIQEAYQIARQYKVFVSESFLIGSAHDGRAYIIEKSPEKTVLYSGDSSVIICTNHFQSDAFSSDKFNDRQKKETPSLYRLNRTKQLIKKNCPLDEAGIATVLRDPKGMDDLNIGYTNEMAVNQYVAHHSVIFKPGKLLVWVSTKPYQLGTYVCYDLNNIFNNKEYLKPHHELYEFDLSLWPDSALLSEYFSKVSGYIKIRDSFINDIRSKSALIGEQDIKRMIQLNPEFYQACYLAGEYYYNTGMYEKALTYYKMALNRQIPYYSDRELIKERINSCNAKMN